MFVPGDRGRGPRRARPRLATAPVLLFVGRIQPLKGADLAVRASPSSTIPTRTLLVVGGPSGPDGDAELARLRRARRRARAAGPGALRPAAAPRPRSRPTTAPPTCAWCPSRTESFGLVALEAAACGTPVVAAERRRAAVLVDDGATGFLVDGPVAATTTPRRSTSAARDPELADELGRNAAARARAGYTWSIAAARLRRLYGDLVVRARRCSAA